MTCISDANAGWGFPGRGSMRRLPAGWRRFPGEVLSGPPAEAQVGERRARPGSPLRQPLLAAPRQYQPGLIRSSMLVPGSTRPSSEKRQVRATCRRSEKGKAGVGASLEARKVGCQPQPGQARHEKCRARASCAGELQLWVPVCERGCQLTAQGARKSHLCADQCVLRKHCYRGYRFPCPMWCVT